MTYHYRSQLVITPFEGELTKGGTPVERVVDHEPIVIDEFIPISTEDISDPALRLQALELAVYGLQDFVEYVQDHPEHPFHQQRGEAASNATQTKENHTA